MPILDFEEASPSLHSTCFIAPDSWVIGQVTVGARCSLFFGSVLRGDINPITIGEGTNIQEHVVVHTSHGLGPATIGSGVTVGHRAIIHGCTVEDNVLIGMGATILDQARIGTGTIIGAHTLIPKGIQIPPRSMVMGTPGKVVREITDAEYESILAAAKGYAVLGERYRGAAW